MLMLAETQRLLCLSSLPGCVVVRILHEKEIVMVSRLANWMLMHKELLHIRTPKTEFSQYVDQLAHHKKELPAVRYGLKSQLITRHIFLLKIYL